MFGDGVRCVGGSLWRLAIRGVSGATLAYPEPGDPSVSARSAALGDVLVGGATRFYPTYCRDPALTFCAFPAGNTYNATNAVEIVW